MNHKKNVHTWLLMLSMLAGLFFAFANTSKLITQSSSGLTITATTNQPSYLLRQQATLNGSITLNGSPATDLVVAMEVKDPYPFGPYFFRTLQIGNPVEPWLVNITSIHISNETGGPIDTVKAGSLMQVGMSVYNTQSNAVTIFATITVFDANGVCIGTRYWTGDVDPQQSIVTSFPMMEIPTWAGSGRASIIGCVYSSEPTMGGIAYCLEKAYYYYISRMQSGLLGITQPSPPSPQTTPGVYTYPIRLPPDPTPGKYTVYVLGQSAPNVFSPANTTFTVQSTNGIPPQASFAYWPLNATIHATVNFDGSSSSPEGYNDYLTRFEWNFGDGTPNYLSTGTLTNPPNETVTHKFAQANQYIVTLNVTNNEGLWSTTSKPITIDPGYGPTASFTWLPTAPLINHNISFDASGSTPGDYSTLVSYQWNFSDGTGLFNVSTPQIIHSYTQPNNYTVSLKVQDSLGRTATTSALVRVQNLTAKIGDVNHDGGIDGSDIAIVAYSYGTIPGDLRWNPAADVNGDGGVDGSDLAIVASYFGQDP